MCKLLWILPLNLSFSGVTSRRDTYIVAKYACVGVNHIAGLITMIIELIMCLF